LGCLGASKLTESFWQLRTLFQIAVFKEVPVPSRLLPLLGKAYSTTVWRCFPNSCKLGRLVSLTILDGLQELCRDRRRYSGRASLGYLVMVCLIGPMIRSYKRWQSARSLQIGHLLHVSGVVAGGWCWVNCRHRWTLLAGVSGFGVNSLFFCSSASKLT